MNNTNVSYLSQKCLYCCYGSQELQKIPSGLNCWLVVHNIGNKSEIDADTRNLLNSVKPLEAKKNNFYCNKRNDNMSSALTPAETIEELDSISLAHITETVSQAADKDARSG